MLGMTLGTLVPARRRLLAFTLALIAAAPIAARADDGLVDVRALPRLEGAVEDTARTEPHRLSYGVPSPVAITTPAVEKLLAANGWMQYSRPLEASGSSLLFKKGRQGLFVSFTQGPRHPDQSGVSYAANRINANVPFPADATNLMFDDRRPYLGCVSTAAVRASLDFFRKELAASGWSPLSDADIAAHWPNAKIGEKSRTARAPIMARAHLTAVPRSRRSCCRCNAAATATPPSKSRSRRSLCRRISRSSGRRSTCPNLITPRALAAPQPGIGPPQDRRRHGCRNPRGARVLSPRTSGQVLEEEASGAVITDNEATLVFSSPEQTATLRLGHKYDLTTVSLVAQVKESALAARAKARKEADEKFATDAMASAKRMMAADEVRRPRKPPTCRMRRCMRSPTAKPRCHCRKAPRRSNSMATRANWNSTPPQP